MAEAVIARPVSENVRLEARTCSRLKGHRGLDREGMSQSLLNAIGQVLVTVTGEARGRRFNLTPS
jgi:hypothetical protein